MPIRTFPPTLRRTLEQVEHCVREARSVVEAQENEDHAINDLEHAAALIQKVMQDLHDLRAERARQTKGGG
jgi:homoserine kinase